MRIALHINRTEDPDTFAALLTSKEVPFERIAGLPRHFIVEAASGLALARIIGTSMLGSISDADKPISPAMQPMSIGATMEEANWALPRTIRRSAPWLVDWIKHPIETYYRSERDGTGVDVYWFDTGIKTGHDEFSGRATYVYEYVSHSGGEDTYGHGTLTASCAVGDTCGFARGAEVFAFNIEAVAGAGSSSTAALLAAIGNANTHYSGRAGLNRPAVANCSFEPGFNGTIASAIEDMMDDGIVWCFSAGNGGVEVTTGAFALSAVTDLILTGAANAADLPMNALVNTFSGAAAEQAMTNWGTRVDIMAPGTFIRGADRASNSAYQRRTGGTSCASAHTAGVIACMLEGHDRLTSLAEVQAVRAALLANSTTGKFRNGGLTLPDRILYLDPNQVAPEPISGL